MTTYLIPWPPSANSIWRAVNGRNILSKRYREWKEHAGRTLLSQRPKKVKGPVKVCIELTPPDKRALETPRLHESPNSNNRKGGFALLRLPGAAI